VVSFFKADEHRRRGERVLEAKELRLDFEGHMRAPRASFSEDVNVEKKVRQKSTEMTKGDEQRGQEHDGERIEGVPGMNDRR